MVDRLIARLDGPVLPHPNCFYLNWKKKTAVWCDIKHQTDIKFQVTVNWPELRLKITIASDCTSSSDVATISEDIPVSYLKSHLQKSIRRSNPYKSLKTASGLIRTNPGEFLRRVLIIAIEDSLPLDGYAVLTWFMAAHSKGYTLNSDQIDYCLGYTYDLAKCSYYERCPVDEQRMPDLTNVPVEGKDLVYSLLFREAYGGLANDKKLCRQVCSLWVKRWQTGSIHLQRLKREVKFISPSTDTLFFNDWYLAALDFHCCPNLLQHVREKFDQYSEPQIKMAIWYGSSSLTNKKNISALSHTPDSHEEIWNAIKKVVHAYATYIIYKM